MHKKFLVSLLLLVTILPLVAGASTIDQIKNQLFNLQNQLVSLMTKQLVSSQMGAVSQVTSSLKQSALNNLKAVLTEKHTTVLGAVSTAKSGAKNFGFTDPVVAMTITPKDSTNPLNSVMVSVGVYPATMNDVVLSTACVKTVSVPSGGSVQPAIDPTSGNLSEGWINNSSHNTDGISNPFIFQVPVYFTKAGTYKLTVTCTNPQTQAQVSAYDTITIVEASANAQINPSTSPWVRGENRYITWNKGAFNGGSGNVDIYVCKNTEASMSSCTSWGNKSLANDGGVNKDVKGPLVWIDPSFNTDNFNIVICSAGSSLPCNPAGRTGAVKLMSNNQASPISVKIDGTTVTGSAISLTPGSTHAVEITMKNTGSTPWTAWTTGGGAQYVPNYSLVPISSNKWGKDSGVQLPLQGTNSSGERTTMISKDGTITFSFNITAPSVSGSYPFQWKMAQAGSLFGSPTNPISLVVAANKVSAQFVSELVKSGDSVVFDSTGSSASVKSLTPGQKAHATIVMKNTGNVTWTNTPADTAYKLGSQNPRDNLNWGLFRVVPTTNVAPGKTYAFDFDFTVPAVVGDYHFQWRMLQERVAWFSDGVTPDVVIPVRNVAVNGGWSAWSACSTTACGTSGVQTRTCTNPTPTNGGAFCPADANGTNLTRSCSAQACATCTSWTYSAWTNCYSGSHTRTVVSSYPTNCVGGSPNTFEYCSAPTLRVNNVDAGGTVVLPNRDAGIVVDIYNAYAGCTVTSATTKSMPVVGTYTLPGSNPSAYPNYYFPKHVPTDNDTVVLKCSGNPDKSVSVKIKPVMTDFSVNRNGSNIVYGWNNATAKRSSISHDSANNALTCEISQDVRYYEGNNPNVNNPSNYTNNTLSNVSDDAYKAVAGPCKDNNIFSKQYCRMNSSIRCLNNENGLWSDSKTAQYNMDLRNSY